MCDCDYGDDDGECGGCGVGGCVRGVGLFFGVLEVSYGGYDEFFVVYGGVDYGVVCGVCGVD